jgi:sugar O-acyltransferase (sialic acid O-acetyltransferase NeuD family)
MKLLVLGTRTLAEEVADLISEMPGCKVAGFVENMDRSRCETTIGGLPVYWIDDVLSLVETHCAVCALSTTHRHTYIEQARKLGLRFPVLVHPSARVSATVVLGEGCFVSPFANISAHTRLGENVFVNRGALIGHHTTIGSCSTIQPGANIAGMVSIGERTYVGMGSVIIDKINIGSQCIVGAGAVVTSDVPDRVQVIGAPARIVKSDIDGK